MSQRNVIVLGAGISGLFTASQLQAAGLSVIVLEARSRVGGRIWSEIFDGIVLERGAEFIHGDSVATWRLLKEMKLDHREGPVHHSYLHRGKYEDCNSKFASEIEQVFEVISLRYGSDISIKEAFQDLSLEFSSESLEMAYSMLLSLEGADENLSLSGLEWKDADCGFLPKNFFVSQGYSRICEHLGNGLEIELDSEVTSICWNSSDFCRVTTSDGREYEAAQLVVTFPLGVLKSNSVNFNPKLPESKLFAIEKLGMSKHVKQHLIFDEKFWNLSEFIETDGISRSWWARDDAPVLSSLSGGRVVNMIAAMSPEERVQTALRELAPAFGEEIFQRFQREIFTDWSRDSFSLGGYSYNPKGASTLRKTLAEPLSSKLFFAGEATCFDGDFGTVHGTIESAKRCAKELLSTQR